MADAVTIKLRKREIHSREDFAHEVLAAHIAEMVIEKARHI